MLLLTRRVSETIRIAKDLKVTVLGLQGDQVKLGIDVPKAIRVHCEEIYNRI